MTSPSTILIHARGRQTPDECDLWNRLNESLRSMGSRLAIISHHDPKASIGFEQYTVPNGLDNTPSQGVPPERIGTLTRDRLLERERLWRGPRPDESQRRQGIEFFRSTYAALLSQWNPSLVAVWNGHHPQEMILAELARERGIPVVWLERGPLPRTLHFDREGILGGSAVAKQRAWEWQSDSEQRRWSAVFQRYLASIGNTTWWAQPDSVGPDKLRASLRIPEGQAAICFAGQVDRDVQNLLYSPLFERNLDAFSRVRDAVPQTYFLLGKHHPKSDTPAASYQQVLGDRPGVWATDVALSDCIGLSDRFVAVNSTSLFEAMFAGKPTLALGQSLLAGKGIAYEVHDLNETDAVVSDWLDASDWDARRARFNDFCAFLLSRHLYATMETDEHAGLKGVQALAERLIAWASSPVIGAACA